MRHATFIRQISRSAPSARLGSIANAAPLRSYSSSSSSSSTTLSSLLLCRVPSSLRLASRPSAGAWTLSSSRGLQARRGYADGAQESESSKKDEGEAKKEGENQGELSELDKVKADLEAKNKENVGLKDSYLRSVADFRNLQERSKREQASARDFAITRFAKDLVESIDNLDRAMGTVPADKLDSNTDLKNLYDGLKMTENILMSTLAKHGLERFDPSENAEKFDPNRHEAAFMTKIEGKEDNTVFNTIQKGFSLNGRIIRAAKVGVVKNS